jgi:hypothetical protein
MIPVPAATETAARGPAQLTTKAIDDLESLERGLTLLARDVPLDDGVRIDALALDREGRPALVLVENDGAEPLFLRGADALLAFRKARGLLARLLVTDGFEEAEPRLVLVARRFSERDEARCRLLAAAAITCIEATLIEGGEAGSRLLPLARGLERLARRTAPIRLFAAGDDRKARLAAKPRPRSAPRRRGADRDAIAVVVDDAAPEGGSRAGVTRGLAPNGTPATEDREVYDGLCGRLRRIAPNVVERTESDGTSLWLENQLLARIVRGKDGSLLAATDPDAAPSEVRGGEGIASLLDSVFERLFNLAATRKRNEPRGAQPAPHGAAAVAAGS